MKDTIYALSTPIGNGVAVIRISGTKSLAVLEEIFSKKGDYAPNMLYYGDIVKNCEILDEGMAVYFASPKSYTGEDVAELHCHGSYAGIKRILFELSQMGLRQAEPGEFTKRAYINGRMDLTRAEAVMDFIHASAELEAKAALGQLKGSLYKTSTALQEELIDIIASLEAAIDYPDEDWQMQEANSACENVKELYIKCKQLADSGKKGRVLRDGYKIAIVGSPNVGKSSLLNALLGEEKAIVTDIPGTTRDLVEGFLDWDGIPVKLIDTAGIRNATDKVEQIGVELAYKAMQSADLVLAIAEGSKEISVQEEELFKALPSNYIIALSKSDLPQILSPEEVKLRFNADVVTINVMHNGGTDSLKNIVRKRFESLDKADSSGLLLTNTRHIAALIDACENLKTAQDCLNNSNLDCAVIDLRSAWHQMGEITGNAIDEKIIDRIFSKFCLGK